MKYLRDLEIAGEREALKLYLEKKGLPMSLIQQIIAAFTSLETTGSAVIGPIDTTEAVTLFGSKYSATESVTLTLKKV